MSIKIVDLYYTYMNGGPFEKSALNNINIEINDGEFVGIIGHTGSGKSTLIQHLNGILKPTKGSERVKTSGGKCVPISGASIIRRNCQKGYLLWSG